MSRLLDRVPLSFLGGLLVGALAAALLFVGCLFGWAVSIIRAVD